jgi:hypothetical protein
VWSQSVCAIQTLLKWYIYLYAGYPAPEMKWYHIVDSGMRPVIDDDKHIINQLLSHGQVLSVADIWYQMTIINVQALDYGIYICEGTNKYGTDRLEITIYGQFFSTIVCCQFQLLGEILVSRVPITR